MHGFPLLGFEQSSIPIHSYSINSSGLCIEQSSIQRAGSTTIGTSVAGGVLRLRWQRTMPSITTMPTPGISPSATLSSSDLPAVCCARSRNTKSAARPGSINPQSSLRSRAVLPVAKQNTCSGARPPRLESSDDSMMNCRLPLLTLDGFAS